MEVWKPIDGAKGLIEVSNMGRVRSLLRGKPNVLKTQTDRKGYHRVRVTLGGEKTTYRIHREVAKVFIPNPGNLPQVNHKNGDKNDNAVDNLEWVTNQENACHAIKNGLWESVFIGAQRENEKRKTPVIGYFVSDCYCESKRFESVAEAERHIGSRHVTDVLKGKRSHAKGWTFRYEGGDAECRH